jgi:diamine N-acetyltransferase
MNVSLREITASTVRAITNLAVAPDQQRFVASNAVSLAEALFSPEAWYRAIYLSDDPVGFVMLYDETLRTPLPEIPQIALWRFMIDAQFQGRGVGGRAEQVMRMCVRSMRSLAHRLVCPGPEVPRRSMRPAAFPTGQIDEGEIVLELPFRGESAAKFDHARFAAAFPMRVPSTA